jgi:7-dehydrocholesterol reductase
MSDPSPLQSPLQWRTLHPLQHMLFVGPASPQAPHRPALDTMHISFIRAWFWPVLLILWTCPTALLLPTAVYHYNASAIQMFNEFDLWTVVAQLPRPTMDAFWVIVAWTVFQGLLLEILPGPLVKGPVTPMGVQPVYKDNGLSSWMVTHTAWLVLGPILGLINMGALYPMWGSIIATANLMAVPFCVFLYWKGRYFPSTPDAVYSGRPAFDFFQGIELHPSLLHMNLKQLLNCRVSMMGWSVSYLCFAVAQYEEFGYLSTGFFVTVFLHVVYLLKFFLWEVGYFGSIDIIHDRCGYYIVWGVLCWVPSVYCVTGYSQVQHPFNWTIQNAAIATVAALVALMVNWEADHQRQIVRATDGNAIVWGKKASVIRAKYTTGDGQERQSLLVCCGFWSVSRHFHYVPELTLALIWSIPAGFYDPLPWIYWGFLFFLLVDRADRDEEKCSAKYGKYWAEYCQRVPYKIIPYLY